MQRVTVLGSTGSIGRQTLDVLSQNDALYQVFALVAGQDWQSLWKQCQQFKPVYAALANEAASRQLADRCRDAGLATQVLSGPQAIQTLAAHAQTDVVVAAIAGGAGLRATWSAVESGKKVLLANKEALVMAGDLMMQAARDSGAQIVPVDSEHNGVFQCLPDSFMPGQALPSSVDQLILTASGGPFLSVSAKDLHHVTPQEACAHPKWRMGAKISVDSATMMNKGLELIEAHFLFGAKGHQLAACIHPQSTVHALVRYHDGGLLAHMGPADMRHAIAHALGWPDRIRSGVERLDISQLDDLSFMSVDEAQFPCFSLALQALQAGGAAPIVLNAANEIAVGAFLREQLPFLAIVDAVKAALATHSFSEPTGLKEVLAVDHEVRCRTQQWLDSR